MWKPWIKRRVQYLIQLHCNKQRRLTHFNNVMGLWAFQDDNWSTAKDVLMLFDQHTSEWQKNMKSWILLKWTTLNAWIFWFVEDPAFEAESPAGATIDTSNWIEIKHDGKPINGLATIRHIYTVGICGICNVQFKTVHPRVPKSAHALFLSTQMRPLTWMGTWFEFR